MVANVVLVTNFIFFQTNLKKMEQKIDLNKYQHEYSLSLDAVLDNFEKNKSSLNSIPKFQEMEKLTSKSVHVSENFVSDLNLWSSVLKKC